jgi:hypothetical protein
MLLRVSGFVAVHISNRGNQKTAAVDLETVTAIKARLS